MDKPTLLRDVTLLLELAAPLMLGALAATMNKRFVFPRLRSRLGPWLNELVSSPANRLVSFFYVAVLLGLAVFCHPSNATEALAWLHAHPELLPVQPTPFLLQATFHGATFFCAYQLTVLPMAPSTREDREAG
ncbi:hypothetical protein [Archangium lipolyticum]|uniref:hypothetical protein n=1 Tax=Archangium lipolyticum TaxID=2970465 RepID=UPI002149F059|nr:hypothetical protein [Archangium lipolyticum]